jgi:putative acetyltransferase
VAAFAFRAEEEGDRCAVGAVHEAAFGQPQEARLVEALRANGKALVSLVGVAEGAVVGHVLFSPVAVTGLAADACVGLAPLAVLPKYQRRGIGGALVKAGLAACRSAGFAAAVVLGDPRYYRRFGFVSARQFGLSSEYDAPEDAFMALELRPGALDGAKGLCRYADEFRWV